ncbi:hypothetical protein Y032_0094g2755 [Ancylostoma ceylanicum]|uniref:Hexosyltransferase n=1 Tax=Ancylostoma ceylanicum TaxID=53326 RepID=A0A016TLA2_9BILA|nr:hypothetical protein Y032_0094g2755 [Ancylostoma ceylanicum]
MRRWQRPSQHPSPVTGALLFAVVLYVLHSVLFLRVLSPSVSLSRSPAPAIAFITSSDPKKTALCERTWLKRLTSYIIFTSIKKSASSSQVHLPHRPGSLWSSFSSKALFAQLYVPHHYSWYLFTSDDSYVLVDDLMQDLAAFDSDEPYLAVIGPSDMRGEHSEQLHSLVVASRGAMTTLWENIYHRRDGCAVTSSPDLCLGNIVLLNLKEDAHERSRFVVLQRHFSKYEMSEYTYRNGHYNDEAQMFTLLSGSLISAHNLTVQDFRILDLLLNRVIVLPNL